MKTSSIFTVAVYVVQSCAFPSLIHGNSADAISQIDGESTVDFDFAHSSTRRERRAAERRQVGFNPSQQHVETTGDHEWKAPNFAAGDQRGPCPGLNALANHGYLPHSGVATLTNILEATNQVYGMGVDLSTFLAVFGTVFDGYPLSLQPGYSIGGPAPQAQNIFGNLGGLLGTPQGLSGSHNRYESDTSPTRPDLYLKGQDYMVETSQFQQYYDALVEGIGAEAQYDQLFDFRIARYNHSVENNPYFFFSPFAGILVAPAGYSFPPAFMANHSTEFPEGMLSKESLMSFFGISGKSGAFQYKVGHERIPDNFYRRAVGDEYTIPGFLADVVDFAERDPRLLAIGGNTGTPNSFAAINIADFTNGAFNFTTLLEGNNLQCFVFQSINAAGPDVLSGLFDNPTAATQSVTQLIANQLAGLSCPQLTKINKDQYQKYPGYQRSGSAI